MCLKGDKKILLDSSVIGHRIDLQIINAAQNMVKELNFEMGLASSQRSKLGTLRASRFELNGDLKSVSPRINYMNYTQFAKKKVSAEQK
jgi:hypothetical protein